ncbi:hypothetical protein NPJ88_006985 [Halomonas elongata]|uniref:hypothetical protein n=1 Tax=Halomonas elongata TaxID=2746 RepID=UPI00255A9CA5|nr:hypothetical protein [Halomonas elongata]MDL4862071.1 hypothetical protein [Halomonas elongata]
MDYTVSVRPDHTGEGTNRIDIKIPGQEIMILTERDAPEDYEESEVDTALYYAVERIAALEETVRLAERVARAKGRYHQQHAHCDLMEHFGVPCVRPGDEPEMVTCGCGDMFPINSYGAGFMAAKGFCENCDMMNGGSDD